MPQIGPLEILIVAVLALVVFGPEKLPGMARSVGRSIEQLKRMASEVKSDFDVSLADEEVALDDTGHAGKSSEHIEPLDRTASV